jgi:hypothetical protein
VDGNSLMQAGRFGYNPMNTVGRNQERAFRGHNVMAAFNPAFYIPPDKIINFVFRMAMNVGVYFIGLLGPGIEQIRSQNISFDHNIRVSKKSGLLSKADKQAVSLGEMRIGGLIDGYING